jgi:hypothetical protein
VDKALQQRITAAHVVDAHRHRVVACLGHDLALIQKGLRREHASSVARICQQRLKSFYFINSTFDLPLPQLEPAPPVKPAFSEMSLL